MHPRFLHRLSAKITGVAVAYLGPPQTSMIKLFCKSSWQVKTAPFCRKKTFIEKFDRVLNIPLCYIKGLSKK